MNIEDAWDDQIRHTPDAATGRPRKPGRHAQHVDLAQRAMQVSTSLVCLWTLIETPWEWSPADDPARVTALVASKCLLLGAGAAAMCSVRYIRGTFAVLCAASVLVVSSTLPFLYSISRPLFALALIECVLKTAAAVSWVVWYVGKTSVKKAR